MPPPSVPTHSAPSRSVRRAVMLVGVKPSRRPYVRKRPSRYSLNPPACVPTHSAPPGPAANPQIELSGSPSLVVNTRSTPPSNRCSPLLAPTQTAPGGGSSKTCTLAPHPPAKTEAPRPRSTRARPPSAPSHNTPRVSTSNPRILLLRSEEHTSELQSLRHL